MTDRPRTPTPERVRHLLGLVGALLLLGAGAFAPSQSAPDGAPALGWLGGSWAFEENGQRTEEHWTSAASDTLLDMSRTARDGKGEDFPYRPLPRD